MGNVHDSYTPLNQRPRARGREDFNWPEAPWRALFGPCALPTKIMRGPDDSASS